MMKTVTVLFTVALMVVMTDSAGADEPADATRPASDEPGIEGVFQNADEPADATRPASDEPGTEDATRNADEPGATKQPVSGKLRLKPNAKWHMLGHGLAIPAYFLLQTTIHEGSHALGAACSGARVTEFQPYPHMIDGNFVWGSMNAEGEISRTQEGLILAAPLMTDVLMFTATDLTLTYGIDSDSAAAPFFLMAGMVAPLVDFLWHVNGPSEFNDSTRWSKMAGIPKWSVMLVGDALAAVAVWRILHHGNNIFFTTAPDDEPKTTKGSVALTPVISPRFTGLALAGRF